MPLMLSRVNITNAINEMPWALLLIIIFIPWIKKATPLITKPMAKSHSQNFNAIFPIIIIFFVYGI